jgi:hypothetical protein
MGCSHSQRQGANSAKYFEGTDSGHDGLLKSGERKNLEKLLKI